MIIIDAVIIGRPKYTNDATNNEKPGGRFPNGVKVPWILGPVENPCPDKIELDTLKSIYEASPKNTGNPSNIKLDSRRAKTNKLTLVIVVLLKNTILSFL